MTTKSDEWSRFDFDCEVEGYRTVNELPRRSDNVRVTTEVGLRPSDFKDRMATEWFELPSAPTIVYNEILQSDSSEIVDSSRLLLSYKSSGLKDPFEELVGGSKKGTNALGDLPGDVIYQEVTCDFEGNNVQSDTTLDASKDNLD